jgi:dienelactone hydrolase
VKNKIKRQNLNQTATLVWRNESKRLGIALYCLWLSTLVVAAAIPFKPPLTAMEVRQLRQEICSNFFVPDPLPPVDAKTYRIFYPAPGVKAEGVTYATEYGMRVPAILYLPDPLPKEKIPAFIVVNGHGADKYSWYSFYTGILFARGGAAVLTYDKIGDGERNYQHKSGTREHDYIKGGPVMARHLCGLMITDVRQAVSFLEQQPEVDDRRIAAGGYSLGTFVLALTGAVEPRLDACVLVGGGDLDGHGGYWDSSDKKMCQAYPYQSLDFLGDRGAIIYALQAARGPLLIYNGLGDHVVAIPEHGPDFFRDLRKRTMRWHGSSANVFETGFAGTNCSHRPYWLTRPVAEWLNRKIHFPKRTAQSIQSMPTIKIGDWAREHHIFMDKLYATGRREGGTPALADDVPGYTPDELNAMPFPEWEAQKTNFILQTWVADARQSITNDAIAASGK